jgi:hypothetical protein
MAKKIPVLPEKIPCFSAQGISLQYAEITGEFDLEKRRKRGFLQSTL